jgi:phosphopantothenoylcysteine decarboxylase/phosphopantothenate--cysteine ligase
LHGRRIIVTAGATREYLDPVRFISNNSTGELGLQVARALLDRGAQVELVHTGIAVPDDLREKLSAVTEAQTAFDLQSALTRTLPSADALVMLAAVADYGAAKYLSSKRKKDGQSWNVELAETPDVLASLKPLRRDGQAIVGVSLEDSDWLDRAVAKAEAKGCDALLAVELGGAPPFGEARLHCALVQPGGIIEPAASRTKPEAATMLADWLAARFAGRAGNEHGAAATNQAV